MTIWRMLIARWIPKATNTHSQYIILIVLPLQQWLHERASMLRCKYIACLIVISRNPSTKVLRQYVKTNSNIRYALSGDFTRRKIVVPHRRFGTTHRSHLQGRDNPRRTTILGCIKSQKQADFTSIRKPENLIQMSITVSVAQRQRAGLWYPSSLVQTRPKPSDFSGRKKSSARLPSEGK